MTEINEGKTGRDEAAAVAEPAAPRQGVMVAQATGPHGEPLGLMAPPDGPHQVIRGQDLQDPGSVEVRIDYLSVTWLEDVDSVRERASEALGCGPDDWTPIDRGAMGYRYLQVGPGGARLLWGAQNREDVHLSMPGQACGACGSERLFALLKSAVEEHAHATRIDIAFDDFMRVASVQQVIAAIQADEAVTRAKQWSSIEQGERNREAPTGSTVYLGDRRTGRQFLRVYDKNLESKGETNAIRWELVARKEPADTLMRQIVEAGDEWGSVARRRLISFVDFRELNGDTNSTRRPRLGWYETLIGQITDRLPAYGPRPVRTYEQVRDWLTRSLGPTLAVVQQRELHETGNVDALNDIAGEGKHRWKTRHRALAAPPENSRSVTRPGPGD